MHLTPNQAFDHIKEAVVGYLETAYRVADPIIYKERGEILRRLGSVAQTPFVEATPAFPSSHKLADLERAHPDKLPVGLAELVKHGFPVDRFPLYTHQEEALLAAFSDRPHVLGATGTGSGKTEMFVLPILADILKEAHQWTPPTGPPRRGYFDTSQKRWLHERRHETRPAALRAIVLYPMNALVNDQLSRLRRFLARGDSPDWQRRNLNGNVIHFGMYTGLTPLPKTPEDEWRRDAYEAYRERVHQDWDKLRDDLRETGRWPRPESPEMLCRWDMQVAPPDIMVTNYSMLEYMLLRPIESPIFDMTRQWLETQNEARFTLVLDEAHTYSGASGTEVAHLVRRLKERLGLVQSSPKFRAIATTASVPTGADEQLHDFISDLFGEPQERFTLVEIGKRQKLGDKRPATETSMRAFAGFQERFNLEDPMPAIEQLARDLKLGEVDHGVDPQVALFQLVEQNEDIRWLRERTARRATPFTELAEACWPGMGTLEQRETATAGVLAAGSYARAEELADTPPLISMRLHAFFRGIPGIWACINPDCPEVDHKYRSPNRPFGKLYVEPRPWCSDRCGSRVLEVFSCRKCGLLFLGGIPDAHEHSLWPWSDDLSGDRQGLGDFRIFGVEQAYRQQQPEFRSTRTTLTVHKNDAFARPVYEVEPATDSQGVILSPFPTKCPRCQNYRAFEPVGQGREIIEPLRTRGPRSFAMVVEDAFRVQPRAAKGEPPTYGRKALLFSDSRQEAAKLAADLREIHHGDLFRQLLYRALYQCKECEGKGKVTIEEALFGQVPTVETHTCPVCNGSGIDDYPDPLSFEELQRSVLAMQIEHGIDPTNGRLDGFFGKAEEEGTKAFEAAKMSFNVAMRRDIAEERFSLEPLALGSWHVRLPEQTGEIAPFTEAEMKVFVRNLARLLASEHVLLPPTPHNPWDWPNDQVKDYHQRRLITGWTSDSRNIAFNFEPYRKTGRYVQAIADALISEGRLADEAKKEEWLKELFWPLWNTLKSKSFKVLDYAGRKFDNKQPMGIRIDRFELHPIHGEVHRCNSCGFIMTENLLNVCMRCGQETEPISPDEVQSFYRQTALYALPGAGFDDPYPLRAAEHTSQTEQTEARNEERWFQDLFHDDQKPEDHRVDVLSVTTTMEMGIDIGSLLSVGLRNVPPTVSNYQQRSGRAGRRGSSLATVLTFAQFRSHDQYYFDRPREIVSDPPRVPVLYLNNAVIAQRHVNSLVLHTFFQQKTRQSVVADLFATWGKANDFVEHGQGDALRKLLSTHREPLRNRAKMIVDSQLHEEIGGWLDALPDAVESVASAANFGADLIPELMDAGMLPKYAFPVDVVKLSIPGNWGESEEYSYGDNGIPRDLKIALSEYAPGAEIIRGEFPNSYIYRSVGVHDPFDKHPSYTPQGRVVECNDCLAVEIIELDAPDPYICPECGSDDILTVPYHRPKGFTVDAALWESGRERYDGGGRERAGNTLPARLLIGESSFHSASPAPFSRDLYTRVERGKLFVGNKGPDHRFPGFMICPDCGRMLDPDDPGPHTYPADVPPHRGRRMGPRAGDPCPNPGRRLDKVILGYQFFSEAILFGVDLPTIMDAPFVEASGKAVWYSFGTLLAHAATLELQVDPGELQVGVRPVRRPGPGFRLHGEVFLFDDVPGGAGYARAIHDNLKSILDKALVLGEHCPNLDCGGACYHCLYDYRNQYLHPLLDRELGAAVLRYVLKREQPKLAPTVVEHASLSLEQYAGFQWSVSPGVTLDGVYYPRILKDTAGISYALRIIHPLEARPSEAEAEQLMQVHGYREAVHTSFDLTRRPFWVLNNLVPKAKVR